MPAVVRHAGRRASTEKSIRASIYHGGTDKRGEGAKHILGCFLVSDSKWDKQLKATMLPASG